MDMQTSPEAYVTQVRTFNSTTVVCGAITVIASILWLFQRSNKLPPGPPLYLPGLGHLLRLAKGPLEEFRNLRQKYGDVFKIYMGSRMVVVLNGYDAISEVYRTRGPEFAHRPPSFIAEKLAEHKGILNTSGREWTEQRNNIMKTVRTLASSGGHLDLYLEAEVERLTAKLNNVIKENKAQDIDLSKLIRKATCSISFSLVYGRVLDYDCKELTLYTEIMEELFKYFGMLAVVNFVPLVHLLPGDPVRYHRCIQLVNVLEDQVVKPEIRRLLQMYQKDVVDDNGNFKSSYLSKDSGDVSSESLAGGYLEDMFDKRDKKMTTQMTEEQLVKAAGDLMAGSYDTMSNTLLWLVLYLVRHPDVQEKCRKEVAQALDKCGGHVTDVDKADLVYTQATIMETQRLANVGPLPPAHCCDHDTTIHNYNIPKNTIIMANLDSLMMSSEVGDDPTEFRPERFVGENGKVLQPKWFLPYGTGSRMCLGANIAKKELLVFTVGLLSKFKFNAPEVNGEKVLPSLKGDLGLTHVPKPFSVCLEPIL